MIILPMFLVTQTLQFLDKTALNYANLFGFQTALKLTGNDFKVYFGYAVSQYPMQILIGRFPAQKVLAITIFMWGLCVLTISQCTNFHTAMLNRFILGIFEASVSPCLTIMTGWWYTRQEIPLRQFIWYSGLAGISRISPTAPGPAKWQYIFYILGAITMAWSFVIFFFLPDSPASAGFLTPEMRVLAVQRVAANQLGIKNKKFKREQVIVAIKDIKIWILFASVFAAAIPNGVVRYVLPVIPQLMELESYDAQQLLLDYYVPTKTTVLKSVGDITQIVALVIGGVITLNFKNTRLIASTAANIICVVAAACMAYLPRHLVWQRLVSFWLVNCQSVGFAVSLVMVSSNMGGYTHRVGPGSTAYCFGNVAGPFVKQSQAPFYQDATAGLLAGYTVHLIRRDKKYGPPDLAASKEAGMQDKTEYENKDFRYVL
ncbi:major facilitator superfamily domain-containing protein [Mycena leptocephala]|nr:major facilitator superfamily domain-containing protein [Mycena leptocephala]